jgi:hypothetical protein
MSPRIISLIAVLFLSPWSCGQDLLRCTPADVLVYARMEGPWKTLTALISDRDLWSSPKEKLEEVETKVTESLEEGNSFLGFEPGSLPTWVKSITTMEFVLHRLNMQDFGPQPDIVIAFHTPLADVIYDTVTKYLEGEALAERHEDEGYTEVSGGEDMDVLIGKHGGILLVASSKSLLLDSLAGMRGVPAGGLMKSPGFQRVVGDPEGALVGYAVLSRFIALAMEDGSSVPAMPLTMATQMGLTKLQDIGYRETGKEGVRLTLTASGAVPAFDVLSAKLAGPDLLHKLPVETTGAFVWNGAPAELWAKGSALLLDRERCVMAPLIEEQARVVQRMLGLKLEDVAKALAPGVVIGSLSGEPPPAGGMTFFSVPDQSWFVTGTCVAGGEGPAMIQRVVRTLASRAGAEVNTETAGEWTLLVPESGTDVLAAALEGDRFILGEVAAVRRVQEAADAENVGLGQLPAIKTLNPKASAYAWIGLGSLIKGIQSEAEILNPSAGVALSMEITPDRFVCTSKQPLVRNFLAFPFLAAFIGLAASSEVQELPAAEPPPPAPPAPDKGEGK